MLLIKADVAAELLKDLNIQNSELYAAYAAGRLDAGFVLLLETQAALRPEFGAPLLASDMVGGALMECEPEAELSAGALEQALAALDDDVPPLEAQAASDAGDRLNELIRLPQPLQDFAFEAAGREGWKSKGRGLSVMPLQIDGQTECELLRIEPGCGAPRHSHRGNEFTLVVAGGFTDEIGSYGPGDVSVAGPEDIHQPVADAGEVCLALAVRDGGLQFTGMLGIVQRLLGR